MDAKRRMGEAMGRLLTKKPLKCISVEELVRESGVTRDAYDRTFASMTELAHYEFLHILAVHGRDILGSKSWSEALYKKFLMYKKYEGFFRHLYESDDNEHFRRTNRRFVRDAYTHDAEALWGGRPRPPYSVCRGNGCLWRGRNDHALDDGWNEGSY